MKKGLLAAAIAAPLAIIPGTALATTSGGGGTTTPANSIYIYPTADYGLAGSNLDVDMQVKCSSAAGPDDTLMLTVDQYPPETPVYATGIGSTPVVCDGKSHLVDGTIVGAVYDGGKAKATATFTIRGTSTTKWITIVAH